MYRWCDAPLSSCLLYIPTHVDRVLDGHIVQTHVKIETLCVQQWPPKQNLGKKLRHMLHLLCHQGQLGTVCSPAFRSRVPLARLPFISGYHPERLLWSTGEWNGALLSSVMRVGSLCMWVQVYDVHLWESSSGVKPGHSLWKVTTLPSISHDLEMRSNLRSKTPVFTFLLSRNVSITF